MNILENKCEVDLCSELPFRELGAFGIKKLLCYEHNNYTEIGSTKVPLNDYDLEEFIKHISVIVNTLKIYKLEILAVAESIISHINLKTSGILKEISLQEKKANKLLHDTITEKRVFTKIIDNILECSKVRLNKIKLNAKSIYNQIDNFFKQNFLSELPEKYLDQLPSYKSDFLVDQRIFLSYIPSKKRIKLLSKTKFYVQFRQFKNITRKDPTSFLFDYLKNPKLLLFSLHHNLLVTSHENSTIRLWTLDSIVEGPQEYEVVFPGFEYSNSKNILNIFLSLDESHLIIVGGSFIEKLDPSTYKVDKHHHSLGVVYRSQEVWDRSKVVLCLDDGNLFICNIPDLSITFFCIVYNEAPYDLITCIDIPAAGNIILLGDQRGNIFICKEGASPLILNCHSKNIHYLCSSSNMQYVFLYCDDAKMIMFDCWNKFVYEKKLKKDKYKDKGVFKIMIFEDQVEGCLVLSLSKKNKCYSISEPLKQLYEVYTSSLIYI